MDILKISEHQLRQDNLIYIQFDFQFFKIGILDIRSRLITITYLFISRAGLGGPRKFNVVSYFLLQSSFILGD